jgi:hypothetical protein
MSGLSDGERELPGQRREGRIERCARCSIRPRRLSIAFSSPSAPPSLAVWGSGSRFAVRSSKRMADNCGRPRNNPAALYFNSGYPSIQTLHHDWPSGWSLYLRDKTASTVATVHFRVWPLTDMLLVLANVCFRGVVSTGRRNTCIKSFCWDFNSQGFTWPFVELTHHFV